MKKKKLSLKSFLFEQENLVIPTDIPSKSTLQPQNYSLDQKVDHFLIQYERESNPTAAMFPDDSGLGTAITAKSGTQGASAGFGGGQSAVATPIAMAKGLGESVKRFSLKSFLFEQDEPVPGGTPDLGALGGPDVGLGGDAGAGGESAPEINVPKPQINLSIFANKVARLISNFDSLVNPKIILLNRAYAYIRQNYDENTAKELLIILETNYEITNQTIPEKERDLIGQVPTVAGAGDVSGGGGG